MSAGVWLWDIVLPRVFKQRELSGGGGGGVRRKDVVTGCARCEQVVSYM